MKLEIEIDDTTHDLLSNRADANNFESPEEYAGTIVETVVRELESDPAEEVSERLEDLGYL
jgi:hypothetical protein